MESKGQNLIEFAIIIAVVVIGAILTLTLLGGNVNEMMQSSTNKVGTFDPFNVNTTSSSISGELTSTNVVETRTIGSADVKFYDDGSASFDHNGQTVVFTKEIMDDLNIVFETAGADGITEEVIRAIQEMIDEHKAEYEPNDVPIQLSFGASKRGRLEGDNSEVYTGNADINMVSMQIGKDVKIIVKDQQAYNSSGLEGIYVIDGSFGTTKFVNDSIKYINSSSNEFDLGFSSNIAYTVVNNKIQIVYTKEKIYDNAPDKINNDSEWAWNIQIPLE